MDKYTQKELLNIVKDGYEEIAEDFSETRKKFLWPELYKLAGLVKDGDSILDVGCGNGRLIEALKNKRINYLGIDNSDKLIALAKANTDKMSYELRVTSYEFSVGNILELNKLIDKKFDYIFCIAVLQHIPGKDLQIEVLRQMKNKLNLGGKIILANWNLWNQPKIRTRILKFGFQKIIGKNKMDFGDVLFSGFNKKSMRYYHAFTSRGLYEIIKKVGFEKIIIYKDKYNYYAILEK